MRRFYIKAYIGDGGEMHATAYPQDICHEDDKEERMQHSFSTWIESPFSGSGPALIRGAKLADAYFDSLFKEDATRIAANRGTSDLYREPSTAGEW